MELSNVSYLTKVSSGLPDCCDCKLRLWCNREGEPNTSQQNTWKVTVLYDACDGTTAFTVANLANDYLVDSTWQEYPLDIIEDTDFTIFVNVGTNYDDHPITIHANIICDIIGNNYPNYTPPSISVTCANPGGIGCGGSPATVDGRDK